jgi:hypothetical protein
MRKWLFLVPLAIILVLVGTLLPVLFPGPSQVTKENAERIKKGMSRAEVEEILGGPAGDYRTVPTKPSHCVLRSFPQLSFGIAEWVGNDGTVFVEFDSKSGEVTWSGFTLEKAEPVSALDLARWRLSRWWERMFGPRS